MYTVSTVPSVSIIALPLARRGPEQLPRSRRLQPRGDVKNLAHRQRRAVVEDEVDRRHQPAHDPEPVATARRFVRLADPGPMVVDADIQADRLLGELQFDIDRRRTVLQRIAERLATGEENIIDVS